MRNSETKQLTSGPTPTQTHRIPPGQLTSILTTDIMAIRELPEDEHDRQKLRVAIDLKLWVDFTTNRLSDEDREYVKDHGLDPKISPKFDSYIRDVAQQHGTRLFLSNLVNKRLLSWQCGEKDGDQKLEALLREIHKSLLIALGKARGRINDRHRVMKLAWVKEITGLQMRVREAWPKTADAVRRFIDQAIDGSPDLFPNLKTNKASLLLFLNDNNRALAFRGFDFKRVKGDLTPTRLFYGWVAAAENRDPESVRQDFTP